MERASVGISIGVSFRLTCSFYRMGGDHCGSPCDSVSGGCVGRFHAHFAGVHHRVVETLVFFQVFKILYCGAEAIKEAQRLEVLTFIIPTTDHSVDFRGHLRSLAVDLFILQDGRGPLWIPLCHLVECPYANKKPDSNSFSTNTGEDPTCPANF